MKRSGNLLSKHKTKKKILTRRQYHQHAIDKKRFPNPEKQYLEKLEEILLVLLRKQPHRQKERMLEVYFNIIEWAQCIWNRRRSRFYFQKSI
jgi:membrane peptidoglycan carboxypeptidase